MVYLRPNADAVDGNWLNESGNNTDLYASLDETTASDTDYIVSPDNPVGEVCKIALGDPAGAVGQPFVLRYRFENTGDAELTVRLLEGTTEIASWVETAQDAWTTQERTLTAPQFAAIGDFSNLFVELEGTSAVPSGLDIDFTTGTLDSRITFTRTTTATRINSSGVVVSAAIDAARFDHNPVSPFAARGLLLEEQRTNLLVNSADLSAWSEVETGTGTVTVTANAAMAPDGTTTADLVSVNRSDGGWAALEQLYPGTAVVHMASMWFKAKDAGNIGKIIGLRLTNSTGIEQNILNVTLTANWVRYNTAAVLLEAGANQGIYIGYMHDSLVGADLSTGLVEFHAWGAQVEAGAYVTSHIPTTSAAVTRAADIAVMTGTNFSDWYNASEGTFVADFRKMVAPGVTDGIVVQVSDGTSSEEMDITVIGANPNMIVVDGSLQVISSAGSITSMAANKMAFAYKLNDFAAALNGAAAVTDTSGTIPTVNRLALGNNSTAFFLTGWISRLQFFNTRKSNAELVTLST